MYLEGFDVHLSWTQAAQQSVVKFISMIDMNMIAPKTAAKPNHLFNKPALAGLTRGQYCQAKNFTCLI